MLLKKHNNFSAFMGATSTLPSFPHFTDDATGFFRWAPAPTEIFLYKIFIFFIFFTSRILTLSWFITSMSPTLTTTRCW